MSLEELVAVSRHYGRNPEYVVAGGGNTSWKDGGTLYVKGSGTSLGEIDAAGFVRMDRAALARIWERDYPEDAAAREAAVLADMMAARAAGEENKRPSVETLLHDILPFAYVVHTHPAVVNAVTCSREGEAAVKRLFGDGAPPVWVPVINPGYVLSAAVKNELDAYRKKYEKPPAVIFLQNHGIFIGADSVAEIQALYRRVIDRISTEIRRKPDFLGKVEEVRYSASIRTLLEKKLAPHYEGGIFVRFDRNNEIARLVQDRAAFEAVSSAFTPDHIVYAGSDPLFVDRTIWATQFSHNNISAAIARYIAEAGQVPKIIAFEKIGVYSIGAHRKAADLAFALFLDAATIAAYTETFGGPCFMPQDKIDFINNWEVERYRSNISIKDQDEKDAHSKRSEEVSMKTEDTGAAQNAVLKAYDLAKAAYAKFGVDTDAAIKAAREIPVSIQCWQGDDVTGFEGADGLSGAGILATGNYPGRARNGDELRADAEAAFALIPGSKRFNLHCFYAETDGKKVGRDELEPQHFKKWMDWSKANGIPLDFNSSCFSHPMADSGWTLSSADPAVRSFWIRHTKAARRIASAMGANQGSPAMVDHWMPDGSKDYPADRLAPRERLRDALDEILAVRQPPNTLIDAVECKLFGIGSEAYVVGSHEFYMGYAVAKQLHLCLDTGHFHPTESIADKISAMLLFLPGLLIHFSRGLRWDSDHVATFSDDLREVCAQIVRTKALNRVNFALDFFDASINRIAAWAIGARSLRKGLLEALLEPTALLLEAENTGKNHERLALMEEFKTLPFGAVWDQLCLDANVPIGADWLANVREYEERILSKRR